MKTIVRKSNGLSLYIYPDETTILTDGLYFQVGVPPELFICDCTQDNALVHESVTPPDDWAGHKYLFDGITWTQNPDYISPKPV